MFLSVVKIPCCWGWIEHAFNHCPTMQGQSRKVLAAKCVQDYSGRIRSQLSQCGMGRRGVEQRPQVVRMGRRTLVTASCCCCFSFCFCFAAYVDGCGDPCGRFCWLGFLLTPQRLRAFAPVSATLSSLRIVTPPAESAHRRPDGCPLHADIPRDDTSYRSASTQLGG